MTPPKPASAHGGSLCDQTDRLGIVNHDHVAKRVEIPQVHLGGVSENLEHLLADNFVPTVQRVMKRFRYCEESLIALDNVPSGINPEIPKERDHATQNLCDPTPDRSGIDVL